MVEIGRFYGNLRTKSPPRIPVQMHITRANEGDSPNTVLSLFPQLHVTTRLHTSRRRPTYRQYSNRGAKLELRPVTAPDMMSQNQPLPPPEPPADVASISPASFSSTWPVPARRRELNVEMVVTRPKTTENIPMAEMPRPPAGRPNLVLTDFHHRRLHNINRTARIDAHQRQLERQIGDERLHQAAADLRNRTESLQQMKHIRFDASFDSTSSVGTNATNVLFTTPPTFTATPPISSDHLRLSPTPSRPATTLSAPVHRPVALLPKSPVWDVPPTSTHINSFVTMLEKEINFESEPSPRPLTVCLSFCWISCVTYSSSLCCPFFHCSEPISSRPLSATAILNCYLAHPFRSPKLLRIQWLSSELLYSTAS